MVGKKLITVSEMAKRLRVTPQAIRKAIAEKRIKGARKIGHYWVIAI